MGPPANIYLSGFMGTGKSTVGRLLARRLKRRFVDADAAIERKAGRSIAEIFSARGEKAFRVLERDLITRLSRSRRQVVALGGGALLSPGNKERVLDSGILVHLSCSEAELWRRLKPVLAQRPLLRGPRPRQRLKALIKKRQAAAAGQITVSTSRLSPSAVARRIVKRIDR